MSLKRSYIAAGGLTALGLGVIAPAIAQDTGGLRATFGVSQSIEASDNFNLDIDDDAISGVRSVTGLSFGLSSITDAQTLSLNLSSQFEAGADAESGFVDPTGRLIYSTQTRSTLFSFTGTYAEAEVNDVEFAEDETSSTIDDLLELFGFAPRETGELFVGDGTRINTGARLVFELGRDAPLGLTFQSNFAHTGYRDVTDPDLFEFESLSTSITGRFRLSDVATLRVGTTFFTFDAEDSVDTERDNRTIFASGEYQVRADLAATGRISYTRNETERTSLANTLVTQGVGLSFGLTKTLQRGSLGATAETAVTSSGRRNTVRVTRAIDLPNGDLSLSLGVVKSEDTDAVPLLGVSYTRDLKDGRIRLGLSQTASEDEEDNNIINSRLSGSYTTSINENSGWGVTLGIAETNTIGGDDDDRLRLDLGFDYRHKLSRDWDLVARYTHAKSERSAAQDRSSNSVSLGVERSFEFRP